MPPFRRIDELITCDEQISVLRAIPALLPEIDVLSCLDSHLLLRGMFSAVVVSNSITCGTWC